jgi:hypothetical protein
MATRRDPVSELLDPAAGRLLARAGKNRGDWVSTRLADPGPADRARAAAAGVTRLDGPDRPSAAGGSGLDARSRWARGLVRALYYQHKRGGGGSLQVQVGRHVPASPQFNPARPSAGGFPPGRAVRIRIVPSGTAALRTVQRLPGSARIYDDAGKPAARHSDPALRDW